jgi:two-component system nitrate/nitrite response regulator NarL
MQSTMAIGALTRCSETDIIGLMLVEDHPVVRYGLRLQLESNPRYRIVGEAGNSEEALRIAKELSPAIALVDVGLPGMDGIELTRQLNKEFPALAVLILSMRADEESVARAVRAGARGYVLKDSPLHQIVAAVEAVVAGGTYYTFSIVGSVYNEPPQRLSPRELEILQHLIKDRSNKEIARSLKLSVRTIESHREAIRRKLGAVRMVDVVRQAVRRGLAQL